MGARATAGAAATAQVAHPRHLANNDKRFVNNNRTKRSFFPKTMMYDGVIIISKRSFRRGLCPDLTCRWPTVGNEKYLRPLSEDDRCASSLRLASFFSLFFFQVEQRTVNLYCMPHGIFIFYFMRFQKYRTRRKG